MKDEHRNQLLGRISELESQRIARALLIMQLRNALSFAKSVIKSGERWTLSCEEIIDGALRATEDVRP